MQNRYKGLTGNLWKIIYCFVYGALFLIAEMATDFYSLIGGLISYTLILIVIIIHGTLLSDRESAKSKLILSMSLIPMVRIMSQFMPYTQFSPVYWYILIYPPIFIAGWVARGRLNYSPSDVGLKIKRVSSQLLIALCGVVFGYLEYLVLKPTEPLIPDMSFGKIVLALVSLGAGTGFVEEFVFRGVLQKAAIDAMGNWGVYYISFLFAILHFIHNSVLDIFLVFAIGLFFAYMVKRTGSLLGVTLAHTINNYMLYVILPYVFS
jgi:membrane protease YdiL (CAAX protease family)